MNAIRFILLFFFIILIQEKAFSANRYWIGGSGNWTTSSHWSATSGGTTDNVLPTSSDNIYIDANSGNGTITVNSAISVYSIDFNANCSSIILDITSNTLSVTNDIYQNTSAINGTIRISGGTLTVSGNINVNAGTFQANSGTVNVNGNYFYVGGGTANFAGSTINTGNSTNEYIRLYSGSLSISAGIVNVTNYIYIDNNSLSVSGGTINIGTGNAVNYIPLYVAGSGNFSGGTINIQSVQTGGGSYATYINNSSTFSGGLIKINATNANYYIYSQKSHNFEINSSGVTAYFTVDANFSGDFTLSGGTANISGYAITTTGQTYLNGGTFQASSGTYTCNGTGVAVSINGATANFAGATINVGNNTDEAMRLYSGAINVTGGTINVKNYFLADVTGFSISGGTMNIGTGGSVTYEAFYIFGNGSFSGGTIDVQSVQTGGSGIALDISSGSTFTGGLMKVTATNANYILWTRKAYNLEINSSGRTASLPTSMSIYGNLTVTAGSLIATGGTTSFIGSSAQSILGTSATEITLYNATLNNSNGLTIAPSSGIATTVKYTLTMTSGKITLGNYTLNIGASGISGSIASANSSNYIITNGTGVLKQYNVGTGQRTSVFYPIGISSTSYSPITLAVSGASTVDDFSVRVSQNVLTNGTSGSAYTDDCVNRTWNITEGTATGSSITISPQWNGSEEFAAFTRSAAYIGHYTGGIWTSVTTGTVSGSNPYTCTSGAITSFSPFAVFDPIVLPTGLVDFEVVPNGDKVDISWTSSTEVNCDYYSIKKSSDGIHFVDLEEVDQTGNPYVSKKYNSLDEKPFLGISYYQLNQFDTDGNIIYSSIKSVNFTSDQNSLLYPNPVSDGIVHISLNDFKGNLEISIFDCKGKLVYYQTAKDKENSIITIDLKNELSNGIYQVQISNEHTIEHHKLYVH